LLCLVDYAVPSGSKAELNENYACPKNHLAVGSMCFVIICESGVRFEASYSSDNLDHAQIQQGHLSSTVERKDAAK